MAMAGTILLNRSKEFALLICQGCKNIVESVVLVMDRSEYTTCLNIAPVKFFVSTTNVQILSYCFTNDQFCPRHIADVPVSIS